jgi:sec-independent protein translocase protein TatA
VVNVGPLELIIVLAIALIVLGPKKLPEVGRSVGRGLREFRGALAGGASGRESADPLADLTWDEEEGREPPSAGDGGRRGREEEEFERVRAEEEAHARRSFS